MTVKEATSTYFEKPKKTYTYQDYLLLPDNGNRYEILEGELVMSPSPATIHQRISRRLVALLLAYVEQNRAGELFYAPYDVIFSNTNVVQPDILFVRSENSTIITEKNIQGAPDLIIEIISPATAYYDLIVKKELYETYGVNEFWLVDPSRNWVEVYELRKGKYELHTRAEKTGKIQSVVLEHFQMNLEDLFQF